MKVEISQFQNEFRLTTELRIPKRPHEVFPFFADARNLQQITPPFLNFRITNGDDKKMSVGSIFDYSLRVHGIPLRWKSLISAWEPPYFFVDEQLKGPYRYWIHRHQFEERDGETVARDIVRYQVFGGSLLHNVFVKRDLINIFNFRQNKLIEIFGKL